MLDSHEIWMPRILRAGTIGYYAPDRVVVLYCSDAPRFSGSVRIGEMHGDLSILRGWSRPRPVTIELAE